MNKSLLFLLITFTLFINYINYIQKNNEELLKNNDLLKSKIEKEIRLSKWLLKNEVKTNLEYESMFFNDTLSYSSAMGKMQSIIKNSITKDTEVVKLNWGSSIETDNFYQPLEMSISMKTTQLSLNKFINNLQSNKKIFKFDNLKITTNKDRLSIFMKITAYKLKKVQK